LDWRSLEVNLVGGLIVAGAIGNLVDRIRHGHVIDFVDVYVNEWHWPSFNVADSAISVSMAWIILRIVADSFRGQDPSRAKS
jgi:signal peptidase II